MTTIAAKTKALAQFLETNTDISPSSYDNCLFEVGSEEYLVLTDKKADKRVREYIKDSVWAFNPDFLNAHVRVRLDKDVWEALQAKCEDANDAILSMIADFDHFVDDAVKADGRGHFLAQYDGVEHEWRVGSKLFFIYRTN